MKVLATLVIILTHLPPLLAQPSGERLKDIAEQYYPGMLIGACTHNGFYQFEDADVFINTHTSEFNSMTAANTLKQSAINGRGRGIYSWSEADRHVLYAKEHDMHFRGHALFYFNPTPKWVGSVPADEIVDLMKEHMDAVIGRYHSKGPLPVHAWDVWNELFSKQSGVWEKATDEQGKKIGNYGLAKMAFEYAHQLDPDAELILDEGWKWYLDDDVTADVYTACERLVADNVPIDGIGFQLHHKSVATLLDSERLDRTMAKFKAIGLDIWITEFDHVDEGKGQAHYYRQAMQIALKYRARAFQMWGTTEKYGWSKGGYIFKENQDSKGGYYEAKPAYYAIQEALKAPKNGARK